MTVLLQDLRRTETIRQTEPEMTLPEYLSMGEKLVQYIRPTLANDPDAIDYVVVALIKADQDYDETRGMKRSSYRFLCCRDAILTYGASKKRDINRVCNLGENFRKFENPKNDNPLQILLTCEEEQLIEDFINSLSENHAFIVRGRLDDRTFEEIGRDLGCRKQNVSQVLKTIGKKLCPAR